jgi:hypothetical protein
VAYGDANAAVLEHCSLPGYFIALQAPANQRLDACADGCATAPQPCSAQPFATAPQP